MLAIDWTILFYDQIFLIALEHVKMFLIINVDRKSKSLSCLSWHMHSYCSVKNAFV